MPSLVKYKIKYASPNTDYHPRCVIDSLYFQSNFRLLSHLQGMAQCSQPCNCPFEGAESYEVSTVLVLEDSHD